MESSNCTLLGIIDDLLEASMLEGSFESCTDEVVYASAGGIALIIVLVVAVLVLCIATCCLTRRLNKRADLEAEDEPSNEAAKNKGSDQVSSPKPPAQEQVSSPKPPSEGPPATRQVSTLDAEQALTQENRTLADLLSREEQKSQRLEKALEDSKHSLKVTQEKRALADLLSREEQKSHRLEKALEDSKHNLKETQEKRALADLLSREEQKSHRLEKALEDSKHSLKDQVSDMAKLRDKLQVCTQAKVEVETRSSESSLNEYVESAEGKQVPQYTEVVKPKKKRKKSSSASEKDYNKLKRTPEAQIPGDQDGDYSTLNAEGPPATRQVSTPVCMQAKVEVETLTSKSASSLNENVEPAEGKQDPQYTEVVKPKKKRKKSSSASEKDYKLKLTPEAQIPGDQDGDLAGSSQLTRTSGGFTTQ